MLSALAASWFARTELNESRELTTSFLTVSSALGAASSVDAMLSAIIALAFSRSP